MTENPPPVRDPDEPADRIEQTATVAGHDNITVQAGHGAQVIVQPRPAPGAEAVRYLAPSLLAGLMVSILGDYLGLGGKIAAALAVIGWISWTAARDTYLRLVQRLALPVIATVYIGTLVVFTVLPDIPTPLQIAIPAICWTAAAVITLRLTETEHRHHTLFQYEGAAAIGGGVAAIGAGVAAILGMDTLVGVSAIGFGITLIGAGVAAILGMDTLVGVSAIGFGITLIGAWVAMILDGSTLVGVAVAGASVALIGAGVAMILGGSTLVGVAVAGVSVAAIGLGVALILAGNILFGVSAIGFGVSAVGGVVALILGMDTLVGVSMIGFGVAGVGGGVAMILDGNILFGVSVIGFGVAVIGFGAVGGGAFIK